MNNNQPTRPVSDNTIGAGTHQATSLAAAEPRVGDGTTLHAEPFAAPHAVAGVQLSGKQVPVLLPRSLYRSIGVGYWCVALAVGLLCWWALFKLL